MKGANMIISASRRTDIPAFYSNWLISRIKEGYVTIKNPFNGNKKTISILPQDVCMIVFFTKNPGPLMDHLELLDRLGYKYYFHFTVNNYPALYEPNLPPINKILDTFRELSLVLGRDRVIWRYDPVIISDLTDVDFQMRNFDYLAGNLKDHTGKCVFSILDFYKKTKRKLTLLNNLHGIRTVDLNNENNRELLKKTLTAIKQIADHYKIQLASCAEFFDPQQFGIEPNSCINGELINNLSGSAFKFSKDRNQRKECLCAQSVDIGVYNTCLHNCTYCYANQSRQAVETNFAGHDPKSPILTGRANL